MTLEQYRQVYKILAVSGLVMYTLMAVAKGLKFKFVEIKNTKSINDVNYGIYWSGVDPGFG